MVDREVFDRRLAVLEGLVRELRTLAAMDRDAFLADEAVQAAAERWLQLACECALDLAQHLIADRGFRTPATYRDAFRVLEEEAILDAPLAGQMESWAGLRNVLVHLYLTVDGRQIHRILVAELGQLEAFARAIAKAAADER